jgi:hypothetical protein
MADAAAAITIAFTLDHTLRCRLPLDQYFTDATKMLENWSKDRINDKIFQHEVVITNELFEIAYNWIWHYKCL